MQTKEIRARCYPSRLSDEDLEDLHTLAMHGWERGPRFAAWLVEVFQEEQLRRARRSKVERFGVPFDWPGSLLAEALLFTSCMNVAIRTATAQTFMDSLHLTVVAVAASRLERT